jgi:F-type H+-transporting ATPase subunit a
VNIYAPLEHVFGIPAVLQAALLAALLLLAGGMLLRKRLEAAGGGVLPDDGITLRNVLEVVVEGLASLARQTMGPEYRRWFPVVGTMFVFILVSNLLGLVPGVGGATSDVNTTTAWAIISFVLYNAIGIRQHGWKYVYQFMGPSLFTLHLGGKHYHVRAMAPFFLILEIPLHFARILTLSIRLLANMFADHAVVGAFLALVPIGVPAIFLGLGALVAVLQAFVFSLLTMIYIGLALEEAH